MGRRESSIRAAVTLTLLGGLVSGCALGRSELSVAVPPPTVVSAGRATPVKIVEVRDLRKFETNPRDPSQPSLGSEADVADAKLTAQAIGRKRGGYGNAMGDFILSDGRTIAGVVRDAARTALEERGYRVVDPNSPDAARAAALSVDVTQFWTWIKPGFFEVTISFESQVMLSGPDVVGASAATVVGHYDTGTAAAVESVWVRVINEGIKDLIQKMQLAIKPSSGASAPMPTSSSETRRLM